jgi:CRISPR-associated protein Cas2
MNNRFMRLMVFFDLPVKTKIERKTYTRFRKYLLNDGFDMIQFSVYSRITRNHDDAQKHVRRIQLNLPPVGSVRLLSVTEKQYSTMMTLVGERTVAETSLTDKDLIEL